MGTNDEYFASLAQLILATAASQKAEQDRKDELAFRRQQAAESLALQREGLALERDRTQAQIATEEERRKGLSFERDRAERADTVAAIDDSMYRMETGETPAQTKMRLSRKKDEAGVRAAEAQATMLEGEAENAPATRDLERRKGEASVKASETQTQAYQEQSLSCFRVLVNMLKQSDLIKFLPKVTLFLLIPILDICCRPLIVFHCILYEHRS